MAFSDKNEEEAPREIALKIKSVFPRATNSVLVFFTNHYPSLNILKIIHFTLKPRTLLGMQVPHLIYEDRIIEKGIIGCCINDESVTLKEVHIKSSDPREVESSLRIASRDNAGGKRFMFSFLPHQFDVYNFLRGVELSLGKSFNIFGAGYNIKYAYKSYQIINNNIDEGSVNILIGGAESHPFKIGGFLPLGKSFTVTKVISKKGVIMEIDNQPAVNIYKNYLEEKFDTFRKNKLFAMYPLGIKEESGGYHLINVLNVLEDGSLFCIGDVKEKTQANIMIMHPPSLFESLEKILAPLKKYGEGLVLAINPMIRKKILKDEAEKEIRLIKNILGDKFKLIGICCDYWLSPNEETREIEITSGNLLLNLWK